jgi:hypothetical protein
LFSYLMISTDTWKVDSLRYQLIQIICCVLMLIVGVHYLNAGILLMNFVWLSITFGAMVGWKEPG